MRGRGPANGSATNQEKLPMDAFATTSPPAALPAAHPAEERDRDVYAGLLRDLREALQEPPECVFRAGTPPGSGRAA
jgi:hypothetical protein